MFPFNTLSSAGTATPITVDLTDSHAGSKGASIHTHIFLNSNLKKNKLEEIEKKNKQTKKKVEW